jgi:hypothetical protein
VSLKPPNERPERRQGAQSGNQNAQKHGLYASKRALKNLSPVGFDGRLAVIREKNDWKARVRADLGGDLSTAEETLLEQASRQLLLIDSVDAWIFDPRAHRSLVNARKRSIAPVLAQRQALVDFLVRLLQLLGLKRQVDEVDVWMEKVRGKYGHQQAQTTPKSEARGQSQPAVSEIEATGTGE